jgi:hypothetical protein
MTNVPAQVREQVLVIRWQAGDPDAFHVLFSRYEPPISVRSGGASVRRVRHARWPCGRITSLGRCHHANGQECRSCDGLFD